MVFRTMLSFYMTLFALTILALVSASPSFAARSSKAAMKLANVNKTVMSADRAVKAKSETPDYQFSMATVISRSTSLIDHQDGTRSDNMEALIAPTLKTPVGQITLKETLSKDLNNPESTEDGASDASVIYGFPASDWEWSPPYVLTLNPTLSAVIPLSRLSRITTQLQTALVGGVSFGIRPDGLHQTEGNWSLAIGLTAGRNFHPYSEDIKGRVLNQYSSNQTLNIGYAIFDWSFSFEFINRSRWTYQNNVKQTFVASQEIGYAINQNLSVSVGHTNEASALKADASESNLNLIDENTSTVYGSLGISF